MFPCNIKVSLLSCVFTTHSVFFPDAFKPGQLRSFVIYYNMVRLCVPFAVRNCLRRLTSKSPCFQSRNIVNSYLSPHQLGVATTLGCEAAIHTTRTFVNSDQNRGKVLLKLDFKNAFNSVERDCILKEVQCHLHFFTLTFINAIEILQLYFSVII
jgi:hypothetical protein